MRKRRPVSSLKRCLPSSPSLYLTARTSPRPQTLPGLVSDATEAKYSTWRRYKRRPTHLNLVLHMVACSRMASTSKWARKHCEQVMRRKLSCPGVGHKTWWALVKERQGLLHLDSVPPLTRPDRSTATSSEDKAALLANIFAEKCKKWTPAIPNLFCHKKLTPSHQS